MKKIFAHLLITGLLLITASAAAYGQIGKSYTGEWKFEAPNAPEGSRFGDVTIKTDAIITTFDGLEMYSSNWVKSRNDSIIYETDFGRAVVLFMLKINDNKSITGAAVWSEGETPVYLKRTTGKGMGVMAKKE